MPRAYDPSEVEGPIYKFWMEKGYFTPDVDPSKKPLSSLCRRPTLPVTCIWAMPSPCSWRHSGEMAPYVGGISAVAAWKGPRWHCNTSGCREGVGKGGHLKAGDRREKFLERVWDWVRRYGNTIDEQLKRMGCSCDWSRLRFTLDPGPSRAVRTTFVNLYNKELIYRGERIINWCIRCSTALSDLEVEYQERLRCSPVLRKVSFGRGGRVHNGSNHSA